MQSWIVSVWTLTVPLLVALFGISDGEQMNLNFGAILPNTALITVRRAYNRKLTESVNAIMQKRQDVFNFTQYYRISQAQVVLMPQAPSPTEILRNLCVNLLPKGVITILYFTNSEVYGSNAASAQYLLQLLGYLGIPVIAWNTDNVGLEQRAAESRILQLAPSVEHQAAGILSIMRRYNWKKFSVVTSQIGGHNDFVRAIREKVIESTMFRYTILDIYTLKSNKRDGIVNEMEALAVSEARIIVLFCTKEEGVEVLAAANRLEITGKNYVWIASQSVLAGALEHASPEFPPGMLSINFNTTNNKLQEAIEIAVSVIAHGMELLVKDTANVNLTLTPNISCDAIQMNAWKEGDIFNRYLRSVSIPSRFGQPNTEFNADGTLKYVELEIMNLRFNGAWDKIGVWSPHGLDIKDIVWPGGSPVPPRGVPEKFNLKVTFMEEAPYINKMHPDNETGECTANRAVRCRIVPEAQLAGMNLSEAYRNPEYFRCCTGFCIDLLQQFSNDLGFSYDLHQVEDSTWGVLSSNGTWNGLIAELLNHKADIVVTSIKINSERQQAVDFTVPFLETGIAIVVAKRTGIISPKAFLEPFDTLSWLMILLVCIHVAAFVISFFEWLSPGGFSTKIAAASEGTFSLCRANWMVWALLFGAAVNVDCPRGFTARFMSNVWGFFSVIFLAIYTANLATFMITREEFYDLTGIEDKLLQNPYLVEPPFRYGTIPHGNTEAVLKSNKPEMYAYMRRYNRSTVHQGITAVKNRELDAFIYDATVLEYRVGQDNDCRLLTVGSWYAMTGYGFALRKKNKYLNMFNRMMIEYRENGDLERLRRFWLQGACKPKQDKRNASHPLSVNQFMSAFLLLGCGVLLTGLLLGLEHIYFRYISKLLFRTDRVGCCSLVSRNIGAHRSSQLGLESVPQKPRRSHKGCYNETCELALRIISKELEQAKRQAIHLEHQLQVRCMLEGREMPRRPHLAQIVPVLTADSNTLVSEIETAL